jgi:hypothetical protein
LGADADGRKERKRERGRKQSFVAVRDELPDDYRAVINDDDKIHRTV